jgi:uncharacterized protein (TIGR03067 family)
VQSCAVLLLSVLTLGATPSLGKLPGEWVLVSTADEKRVGPGSEDCKMRIGTDGRVTLLLGERVTNRGTVTVKRSGKVDLMDLKLTTGLVLGVYELKGDELLICCDEPGKARPGRMKPKGSQWLERWRRVKPRPVSCVGPPR